MEKIASNLQKITLQKQLVTDDSKLEKVTKFFSENINLDFQFPLW